MTLQFNLGYQAPLNTLLVLNPPPGFTSWLRQCIEPVKIIETNDIDSNQQSQFSCANGSIFCDDFEIADHLVNTAGYKDHAPQEEIKEWTAQSQRLRNQPPTEEDLIQFFETANQHLKMRTYFVGYTWTLADFAAWATFVTTSPKGTPGAILIHQRKKQFPYLNRWLKFCDSFPQFLEAKTKYSSKLTEISSRPVTKLDIHAKYKIQFEQFMENESLKELALPPGLTAEERKMLHSIAEQAGICIRIDPSVFFNVIGSEARGEGRYRRVIWRKQQRVDSSSLSVPSYNTKALIVSDSTLMRKFRDDFDLKINMCEEKDFEYFVDLYGAQKQYQTLKALVEKHGQDKFVSLYQDAFIAASNAIQATQAFKRFHQDPLNLDIYYDSEFSSKTVYSSANTGKTFLSIDLKSANFNSMLFYNPDFFSGAKTWGEFLGRFTDEPYMHQSKAFRQKVFWELDPLKINKLSNFLIGKAAKILKPLFLDKSTSRIMSRNTDELLFEIPFDNMKSALEDCKKTLQTNLPDIFPILRIEPFVLHQLCSKKQYFVTEIFPSADLSKRKLGWKGIPTEHFAICWKHFHGLPLEERDLRVQWESEGKYGLVDLSELGQVLPLRCVGKVE